MTFEEKSQWAYGFASLIVPATYFAWLARKIGDAGAVADIAYVRTLLWAIGAGILVNGIDGRRAAKGAGLKDQRDREIARRGNAIGFIVFSVLVVAPFALALRDAETFWIANAIYLAYALTAVIGVAIKAVLYRKGVSS
jgi:hypothetical protein